MRRLFSFVLLATFLLPLGMSAVALAQGPESNLPACCRRNGAHHCMMSDQQLAALLNGTNFTVVHSKCPAFPKAVAPVHHEHYLFTTASATFATLYAHPAKVWQVEAWARASLAGANHKRGPPSVRLS